MQSDTWFGQESELKFMYHSFYTKFIILTHISKKIELSTKSLPVRFLLLVLSHDETFHLPNQITKLDSDEKFHPVLFQVSTPAFISSLKEQKAESLVLEVESRRR
jgi:hypothetical protein